MGVKADAQAVAAVRQKQALRKKARAGAVAAFQDEIMHGARRGAADEIQPDRGEVKDGGVYS